VIERPIRVLLVDDHPVVRLGIRNLLADASDIAVIGEAVDGEEALRMIEALDPDLVLLDMEIPKKNGIEVARSLQERGSGFPRILVLSAYDDDIYIRQVFSLGVCGYLVKEEVANVIVDAVRGVAQGEEGWLSRKVASRMSDSILVNKKKDHHGLTERERQVLEGIVDGKTNQEIGIGLGISEKTTEKHVYSILAKLGVSSRVEAAVHAVRENWFSS
jgi:DNA-binding NarL/FixJ family response regulator